MVLGPREQREAEPGEVVGDRRESHHRVVAVPCVRRAAEPLQVDDADLTVAEAHVAPAQHVDHGCEAGVAEVRRQRTRYDQVADGRQREAIGDPHRQLGGERPPGVEARGVGDAGIRQSVGARRRLRSLVRGHGPLLLWRLRPVPRRLRSADAPLRNLRSLLDRSSVRDAKTLTRLDSGQATPEQEDDAMPAGQSDIGGVTIRL